MSYRQCFLAKKVMSLANDMESSKNGVKISSLWHNLGMVLLSDGG